MNLYKRDNHVTENKPIRWEKQCKIQKRSVNEAEERSDSWEVDDHKQWSDAASFLSSVQSYHYLCHHPAAELINWHMNGNRAFTVKTELCEETLFLSLYIYICAMYYLNAFVFYWSFSNFNIEFLVYEASLQNRLTQYS